MTKIATVLVDDERPARSRLRRMLEPERDIDIVAECSDGTSAIEAIRTKRPDLLFLDIRMPGLGGFDVLDAIEPTSHPPAIIFVTAYGDHAIRAFETSAIDYLLKPTTRERLAKAVAKARARLAAPPSPPPGPHAAPTPHPRGSTRDASPPHQRFVVRSGNRTTFVSPGDIDWIEAAGNYAILHAHGRSHMLRETMAGLLGTLDPSRFARANRSAIINLDRVRALNTPSPGKRTAVLDSGQEIRLTGGVREIESRLAQLRTGSRSPAS